MFDSPMDIVKKTGRYVDKPPFPRHVKPPMKYFRVRMKHNCSACPFTGQCKQCSGKGWYYTHQHVAESDITEIP